MIRLPIVFFILIPFCCLSGQPIDGTYLKFEHPEKIYAPLDTVCINISKSQVLLTVEDGRGNEYISLMPSGMLYFQAGGALGRHIICLKDKKGRMIDKASFIVDCHTSIKDENHYYENMMNMLYWTMIKQYGIGRARIDGQFYSYFVSWLRDHVHTLKGMKYFYPDLKSSIDLYANYQREDGMIWDNINPHQKGIADYWDDRFEKDNFVTLVDSANYQFRRIPVEADVEYLFIEGLYYTWKATGDNDWMKSHLDNAIKALDYCMTNPFRWSEKYQLIKRGYTIDTWDFQNDYDAAVSNGDIMKITGKTRFGIMYGDNTGMAASCRFLAEMLEKAERKEEAEKIRKTGNKLMERTNELSWNGNFYTHYIPEDTLVKRDFGMDPSMQVSLSNSYSLNRGIDHEKCVKIIQTYQQIRSRMPASSPGEWYTIYPPFEKGFRRSEKWEYMNGGVTPIVAGELAHGAFENGFESYAVDILHRIDSLALRTNHYLHCAYRGAMPDIPRRSFQPVSLINVANADIGTGSEIIPGWTEEKDNDLGSFPTGIQTFQDIPFDIANPDSNQQRVCIALSNNNKYKLRTCIEINQKAASVYLLHTISMGIVAGNMILHYGDSSTYADVIGPGKITGWWYPEETRSNNATFRVAWRGANQSTRNIGVGIYGFNNPFPEKQIEYIEFIANNSPAKWFILGLTLSDYKVYFTPSVISSGIPDGWGSAAVVYALIEGMAGVKDKGAAFSKASVTPRWMFDSINQAKVTVRYEASDGYIAYNYQYIPDESRIVLDISGSALRTGLHIPIPMGKTIDRIYVNGGLRNADTEKIENSEYAKFVVEGMGAKRVIVYLK